MQSQDWSIKVSDFKLRRGPGSILLALPAFLPSVISSFFTQNMEGHGSPSPGLSPKSATKPCTMKSMKLQKNTKFISLACFTNSFHDPEASYQFFFSRLQSVHIRATDIIRSFMPLSNQLKGIFLIWQEKPLVNYSPKAICYSLFLVIVFIILLAILRIKYPPEKH